MVFHHPVRRVVRGPSSHRPLVTLVITDWKKPSMSQPTPHPASSQPLNDPLDFLWTWLSKKRRIEHSSIHPCTASGQKLCPLGTAMRVWIKIASKNWPSHLWFEWISDPHPSDKKQPRTRGPGGHLCQPGSKLQDSYIESDMPWVSRRTCEPW